MLAIGRRKARGDEELVAGAQGQVESAGNARDQFAAWLRPAGLDKAQVSLRNVGLEGKAKLAIPTMRPPVPQQGAERSTQARSAGCTTESCHVRELSGRSDERQLPGA